MADRLLETHCSTLFFVDDRVYKRKKRLDLGFVDFRSVRSRRDACRAEVRLNRRFSPDVYLGVATVGGVDGEPCDSLVVMRRLPDARRLGHVLTTDEDLVPAMQDIARALAAAHQQFPAPRHLRSRSDLSLRWLWEDGLKGLEPFEQWVDPARRDRTRDLAQRFLAGRVPLFAGRDEKGRVVDGHGDLLADDVFLLPDGPRLLDCLEFDVSLRVGDGLLDAAFLAMDLERLGRADLAGVFLRAYREAAEEDAPTALEHHYLAYRAHVRCKVACLRAAQTGSEEDVARADQLADLALSHLEAGRVRLVLVGGLPGSGKTSLANELAPELGAVVLSSDEVRKGLHGLGPTTHAAAAFEQGIYTPVATAQTYGELASRASDHLRGGTSVVLDATWNREEHRDLLRGVGRSCFADLTELCCELPDALARDRLAGRTEGASDADRAIRAALAAEADPWPEAAAIETSAPLSTATTDALARVRKDAVPPRASARCG